MAGVVTEANLETDRLANLFTDFFCNTPGNGGGSDSSGLGTTDGAVNSESRFKAHFWDLGAFSRSCITGDDDHLIVLDCPNDILCLSANGKMGWVGDLRPVFQSPVPSSKGFIQPVFQ
jgi:hypothetical protein